MRQLIWKEWHEQSWKLAFACIVICAFAAIGLRTRIILDEEMIMTVCVPALCLLPLLAATGLIPAERSDGTLQSLAALPITLRKIFVVKTLTGLILCAVPLLAAMAVSLAIAGGRELGVSSIVVLYGQSILSALALFIWMFALTVGLPSEARAAMVSIGILMCWAMISAGFAQAQASLLSAISPFSFVLEQVRMNHAELYVLALQAIIPLFAADLAVQVAISLALWFWASRAIARDVNAVA